MYIIFLLLLSAFWCGVVWFITGFMSLPLMVVLRVFFVVTLALLIYRQFRPLRQA